MKKLYVGVDNGLDGGICSIDGESGCIYHLAEMPVVQVGKGRKLEYLTIRESFSAIIRSVDAEFLPHFIIEKPNNAQTPSTAASMARTFTTIECALYQLEVKWETITPQKWQNSGEFWTKPKMPKGTKFDTKAAAAQAVTRLWPDRSFVLPRPRCRVIHDGMADAALIAEFARRRRF